MDVDQISERVDFVSYFNHDTPESFPWCHSLTEQVKTRRHQLSGLLIFDILLTTGGVQEPGSIYPPSDANSLKILLDTIENSNFDALKKDCLVYYLLKWHQDGRNRTFQHERCIPAHFALLADAYWHLDSGIQIARAVAILSDARLNRDYVSKTLEALSLSQNATSLILKYVRTAKPSLTEPGDVDIYVTALAESSLWDAWRYQRTFPEDSESRSRVVQKILHWCLSPKPRSKPLTQLVAFPLSDYEQSLVHEFALHPPSNCPIDSVPAIQDLACLRLIQSGQYAAAIKLDRQFSLAATKVTPKTKKITDDRRNMMDEIAATMPVAERNVLQLELEQLAQGKPLQSVFSSSNGEHFDSIANDLSMSWEEVGPITNGTVSKNHQQLPLFGETQITPIPEHSTGRHLGIGGSLSGRPVINGSDIRLVPIEATEASTSQLRHPTFVSPGIPAVTSNFSPLYNPFRVQASSSGPSGLRYTPARVGPGLFAAANPATPARTALSPLGNALGSANLTPNAFYEPPVTNGIKRPFGQDGPRSMPQPTVPTSSPPPQRPTHDYDIDMYSEDESGHHADHPMNGTEPVTGELPFSIFSHSGKSTVPPRQLKRTETQMKMPPGAFVLDSDEEEETVPERTTRRKDRARVSPPLMKAPASRSSKSRKPTKGANLGRSIPGTLMEDEEDAEDDDRIGPLPAPSQSKKSTRKGRTSRTSSVASEAEEAKAPRRSSRLMNAPSTASSSPEPPPKKASSQTKKSTASRSGSRKKR